MAALLATLGQPNDALWPVKRWPPMRFPAPLAVGLRGGHGPIRYTVEEIAPLRAVFRFDGGVDGTHWFEYAGGVLRHVIEGKASGSMALEWTLFIRPMHDAVIEEIMDNAARAVGVPVERPARDSMWVRILRRAIGRGKRRQRLP